MHMLGAEADRTEPLLARPRPSWRRCLLKAATLLLVGTFAFFSVALFLWPSQCAQPCGPSLCCKSGSSCVATGAKTFCSCQISLWEACNASSCCPDASVCTPRGPDAAICVPKLPLTAFASRERPV